MHDTLDFIIQKTNNTTLIWKEAAQQSIPPESAAKKIDEAMLDWMRDMTKALRIWTDKGYSMSEGELILARVNLGSLVECWLKFFYCAYNEDYQQNPKRKKKKTIETNDLSFDNLRTYSYGILYEAEDDWDDWVKGVQKKRNAIHLFNKKDIGTVDDFYDDVEQFFKFLELITDRLPPVEDIVTAYPAGYEMPYLDKTREIIEKL